MAENLMAFEEMSFFFFFFFFYIEDLTRVVISYDIYETSLRRVSQISYGMTTSVRFSLSYDCFKRGFIA